jgi:hypothetical protein
LSYFVCRKRTLMMYQIMKTLGTKLIYETTLQSGFRIYAMALLQYRLTENSIWQNEQKGSK